MNFNYLYNLFQNMLDLGEMLFKWLNTDITISEELKIPVYLIILASGLTIGLSVRLIRAFLGN